ncbi:VanZ family protein [Olsenella massiliensis]|uniref:VanZ family protein n=1 Tax=Olsenella massiliensis TaxID=1622075 RepID=UPI00071CAEF6|nr:VanZ family protein [Olsenella massiliensis]
MVSPTLGSLYELACSLAPCLIYLALVRRRHGLGKGELALSVLFVLYLWQVFDHTGAGGLVDVLFPPQGVVDRVTGEPLGIIHGSVNLVPFASVGMPFYLNILMFVPLGVFVPALSTRFRRIAPTLAFGVTFSLLIELSQLVTARVTDIDDLIANTVGTAAGFVVWWLVAGRRRQGRGRHSAPARLRGVSPVALAAIAFLFRVLLFYPFQFSRLIG